MNANDWKAQGSIHTVSGQTLFVIDTDTNVNQKTGVFQASYRIKLN